MAEAHLVIWIDTRVKPAAVVSAGIYGEAHPSSMDLRVQPYSIIKHEGRDYEHAAGQLHYLVANSPSLAWVREIFQKPIH